jgi:hypothetical protein
MGDFAATIADAYATEGAAIDLGRGVHEGELATDAVVRVPLRMMNRHGLVADPDMWSGGGGAVYEDVEFDDEP